MTHRPHCHLLLVGPIDLPPVTEMQLPVLQALLSKGHRQKLDKASEDALGALFGLQSSDVASPVAAISLLGEGHDPDRHIWMRADPVHFQLQRDSFALGLPHPPLTQDDTQSLIADLNRHFDGRGMAFLAPHPQRWYLQIENPVGLRTCPLSQALGGDVGRCAAEGPDAVAWRSIVNEIQMLLHDHPVNQHREEAGQLPANSLWPHGAGRLPDKVHGQFDRVWADDVLTRGFAKLAGLACQPAQDVFSSAATTGADLVVIEPTDWQRLEADWLLPLMHGLRSGRWQALTIDFGRRSGVLRCRIERRDLWKFWRRPINLEAWFD